MRMSSHRSSLWLSPSWILPRKTGEDQEASRRREGNTNENRRRQSLPHLLPRPEGAAGVAGHRHHDQARLRHGEGDDRGRPRRLGREPSCALAGQHRPSDQHHAQGLRGRHGGDRHGRHLGPHLQVPARQPWHGRGHRHGDERHRPGAVGHQGQGRRLAALQAFGRHGQAGAGLCRRHLARLPGARIRWSPKRCPWSRRATAR